MRSRRSTRASSRSNARPPSLAGWLSTSRGGPPDRRERGRLRMRAAVPACVLPVSGGCWLPRWPWGYKPGSVGHRRLVMDSLVRRLPLPALNCPCRPRVPGKTARTTARTRNSLLCHANAQTGAKAGTAGTAGTQGAGGIRLTQRARLGRGCRRRRRLDAPLRRERQPAALFRPRTACGRTTWALAAAHNRRACKPVEIRRTHSTSRHRHAPSCRAGTNSCLGPRASPRSVPRPGPSVVDPLQHHEVVVSSVRVKRQRALRKLHQHGRGSLCRVAPERGRSEPLGARMFMGVKRASSKATITLPCCGGDGAT